MNEKTVMADTRRFQLEERPDNPPERWWGWTWWLYYEEFRRRRDLGRRELGSPPDDPLEKALWDGHWQGAEDDALEAVRWIIARTMQPPPDGPEEALAWIQQASESYDNPRGVPDLWLESWIRNTSKSD